MNKENITSLVKKNYFKMVPDFKNEKNQKYSTLILTLVAFSVFGIFAISPTISTIAQLKKELSDNKIVDQKLQEKITNLGTLQNKYLGLKNDLELIDSAMPKNPQAPLLAAQVQSLAKENGISLTRLQIFEVEMAKIGEKPSRYFAFSFLIDGEGNYNSISAFLSSMIGFERIVSLDVVSVSKTEKESTSSYNISLRGQAYFKR